MKVEAMEDSEGLGTNDVLILVGRLLGAIDLLAANVIGATTEAKQPKNMWPTIDPCLIGDDPVVAAS